MAFAIPSVRTMADARPHWTTLAILAAWLGLGGFAFVAAPHGCAWGTDAYGIAAFAVIALAVLLPWWRLDRSLLRRLQLTVAFGFASLALAVAGVFVAGLPLFCP